ncbi:P-loop NTPase [Aeromicrobium halocynthiae]|uniref:P-loop NTPase n=1 Tax=Aeromicrobium halocynthiae TaxID=560557 RepID=A0ABN2VTP4_9ACTN
MSVAAVAVVAAGAPWESVVVREVEAAESLRLARRCMDVAELLAVAGVGVDVAVVDATMTGLNLDAVELLRGRGVLVLGVGERPRLTALGIEVAVEPGSVATTVAEARTSAVASSAGPSSVGPSPAGSIVRPDQPDGPAVAGRLVAVWGPHGAPGRSTLALSLASLLSTRESTLLVDADVYGGSQAQQVALLDDVSGLLAAARSANRGDGAAITDHTVAVGERLDLLSGVVNAQMGASLRPAAVERVLEQVRRAYSQVVADCGFGLDAAGPPPQRDEVTLRLLRGADVVVVVGRADPVGLARLVRGLHDVREVTHAEPVVVLNRVRSGLGWSPRELVSTVRRLAGVEPAVLVPEDPATVDAAVMAGRPPTSDGASSPFGAAVRELADRIARPAVTSSTRA